MRKPTSSGWRELFLTFFILVFALAQTVMAQTEVCCTLKGTIRTASGSPVANAKVILTSIATGRTRSATTNADSAYQFENLPPRRLQVGSRGRRFSKVKGCLDERNGWHDPSERDPADCAADRPNGNAGKSAGRTAQFKQVTFKLERQGADVHLTGTIPATLSDFKIEPPTLLTMPVKNEIPIRVDLTWRKE